MKKYFSLKTRHSIVLILLLYICCVIAGHLFAQYFPWFIWTREHAYDILSDTLSNFIGLLGIGLAVLAILFAIIQLAYKRLSIVQLIIEESYFIVLFYFGLLNVVLCGFLVTYHADGQPLSHQTYTNIAVTETYLFWFMVVVCGIVFYRTIYLTNLNHIADLYIERLKYLTRQEKESNLTSDQRQMLSGASFELKAELDTLVEDNKVMLFNKYLDLYFSVLEINPNSNLLANIKGHFTYWFIRSYKKEDKDIFKHLITHWWNYYRRTLELDITTHNEQAAQIPLEIYLQYRKSKDPEIRSIAMSIFPIRLREIAYIQILEFEKGVKEAKPMKENMHRPILIFEKFIRLTIDEGSRQDLQVLLNQLKQFSWHTNYHDSPSEASGNATRQPERDVEQLILSLVFNNYCWLIYMILVEVLDYTKHQPLVEEFDQFFQDYSSSKKLSFFQLFEQPSPTLETWIRDFAIKEENQMYFVENEELLKALGAIRLPIILSFPIKHFSENNVKFITPIVHYIESALARFKLKEELSTKLFNASSVEDLQAQLEPVQKLIATLREHQAIIEGERLRRQPLSEGKIDEFRNMIHSQWRKSRTISNVFEHFNSIVTDPDKQLQWVGMHRMNIGGAKVMFVDDHYQPILGIEWGYKVNDQVNKLFMQRINECKDKITLKEKNYISAFDRIIDHFPGINIIFLSAANYMAGFRSLTESGNFFHRNKNETTNLPPFVEGVYKGKLQIVLLKNPSIAGNLVGITLPGAMQLERKENSDWMDRLLQVDVTEITEQNVHEIMTYNANTFDPNNAQQMTKALSGILIEIDETLDFNILDPKKIVSINVTES